jgi:heme-binding protein
MMPGWALTVATLWTVATVPGRPGGDGDDAGAPMAQVELRASTAISTSVSTAMRLLDGQNSVVLGPLDSSNSPMNTRQSLDEGEGAMVLPSGRPGHRAVAGAVGAVALAGAMFLGSAAAASAEPPTPPPPAPPNCSPADWAGVRASVAAATSAYLFTHPPVNDFFATLAGQSRDEMRPQLQAYLDANPQVRADLQGIKQPAVDFLDRCR